MSLIDQLQEDLKTAMKARDSVRVSVIRMLRAEIKNAEIASGEELEEGEVLDVLSRYARRRKESAEEYRGGGREDLHDSEMAEYEIVQGYLPQALGDEELAAIVDEVIAEQGATEMKHMGQVMKEVLARAAGRAEGGAVSSMVKRRLSS